jgi:phosphoglycolate phosphatase-like HAD superfamily hydrolase
VRAFERTFHEIFGLPEATRTLKFAGRTDVSLVRECFTQHAIDTSDGNIRRFFDHYPAFLEEMLKNTKGGVCEGILPLLQQLNDSPARPILGLLTGNIRRGAELKLRYYQLWHHFETGAFADDHEDRNCIAAVAKQRGEAICGCKLSGDEIVVLGDTPLDISCAQSIGAKVLAVATGEFNRAKLLESNPTWAVDDVRQIEAETLLGGNVKAAVV